MRDSQASLLDVHISVQEEVEVDRARPPALAADAAELLLNRKQALEELPRAELGLDLDGAVEKRPLLDRAHGLRLPNLGDGHDVYGVLRREQLDRLPEVLLTVAEVGADTDEGSFRHRCYLRRLEETRGHHRVRSSRARRRAVDGARWRSARARARAVPGRARPREAGRRAGAQTGGRR